MPSLHVRHFDAEGARSSPARVVLVHGAMDRHNAFLRVIRRLRHHRVVTYDRRGYGQSLELPAAGGLDRHVADLLEVVGDDPVVVVGHSMGGLIAMKAASLFPEAVRSVGAYEPPTPWKRWWPRHWDPTPDEPVTTTVANFYIRMVGEHAWNRATDRFRAQLHAEGPALVTDLAVGRHAPPFHPEDVRVPVLVGWGTESSEHHIRGARELAAELPDADTMVFEGAQHGAHRSHPDAFALFVERVVSAS